MSSNAPNEPAALWLCLHFPQLPLEVFNRGIDDADKPIVVVESHRVCRVNAAAADLGIQIGNNMGTAYSLGEKLASFERDGQKEHRHLSQLAQWAYQFTPNVSVKAPDCLLLDIAGCLKLFQGVAALKQLVIEGLEQLGYQPTIGINTTPLSALVSAKSGIPDNTGDATTSLLGLPVTALTIDDKTIAALQQMGISHIGKLLQLPRSGINRRFGIYFTDYLDKLAGKIPDPQKFISPAPRFFSEVTFLADVTDTQVLLFPIKRLLGELCDFLITRQLRIRQLNWTLSHRSHPPCSFNIYLANSESDRHVFLALTQLKLDQLDDINEIDSISLTVNRFETADALSGDLFQGTRFQQQDGRHRDSADTANAHRLLNMLHARLGPDTCFGLSLANDHRPEKAWRLTRIGQKQHASPAGEADENPRPAFLLARPRLLNTIEQAPCLGGKLTLLKGPERIDFGWWDESNLEKPLGRDYYIARRTDGSLYWIFHCTTDDAGNRWYLHGIFS